MPVEMTNTRRHGYVVPLRRSFLGLCAWFALSLVADARAQGGRATDPVVRVLLRSATVRVGEPAQLYIEVQGAERVEVVRLPEVQGLTFTNLAGPSREETYIYANGRQQRTVRTVFSTSARPTEKGTYEIPPLTLRVDGREVTAPAEPLVLKVVEDLDASSLLLFEREPLPARVYEGEPYDIDLRFGWDATVEGDVELSLPWWHGLDGVVPIKAPTGGGNQLGVYVNRGRNPLAADYQGKQQRGEQSLHAFRFRRRYMATRPGKLEYGQAVFEFSQILRRGTLMDPGASREYYATLPPFTLDVLPIPEGGRPFAWTGAVGQLVPERSVDRRAVDVGDSLKLQVAWTGHGNLEFFEPPDLARSPGFEGFRVLGVEKDEKDPDRRRVIYDLVPLKPGEQSIPGVPLWVFDTKEERFVEVLTEPVPILVRKVDGADDPFAHIASAAADEESVRLTLADIESAPDEGVARRGPGAGAVFGAFGVLLVGWPFVRRAARRGLDPNSRVARRRRRARSILAQALRADPSPAGIKAALLAYLSARSGEGLGAWIGRDPLEWRTEAEARGQRGLPSVEACAALAALESELDRARFEPEDPRARAVDARRVLAVVKDLEGGVL
jgi:hypothetical protein